MILAPGRVAGLIWDDLISCVLHIDLIYKKMKAWRRLARNGCSVAVVQWLLLDLMYLQCPHALSHALLCIGS